MNTRKIGRIGEETALKYLISQNHQLIARNFHCRFAEIDLISFDCDKMQIVFTEVKLRTSEDHGQLTETINQQKLDKLIRAAQFFLIQKQKFNSSWRIDLLGLKLNQEHQLQKLIHLKNIQDA